MALDREAFQRRIAKGRGVIHHFTDNPAILIQRLGVAVSVRRRQLVPLPNHRFRSRLAAEALRQQMDANLHDRHIHYMKRILRRAVRHLRRSAQRLILRIDGAPAVHKRNRKVKGRNGAVRHINAMRVIVKKRILEKSSITVSSL